MVKNNNLSINKQQIECFLNPDWKRKNWSDEDVKLALMLWTISKKAYRYLRSKKILPLPCETVLRERYKHFKCPPGYLDAVDDILISNLEGLKPYQKVVQLNMDEV